MVEKVSKSNFMTEFMKFINRGNVCLILQMVIRCIQTFISSLVNDIIMPVVSLIIGGGFRNLEITIPNFFGQDLQHIFIDERLAKHGRLFVIIAFCVFVIVIGE